MRNRPDRGPVIQSVDHQDLKLLVSLARRRRREEKELFLIEGLRSVADALDAGWPLELAALEQELARTGPGLEMLERLDAAGVRVRLVADRAFNKLAQAVSPQGIVAAARIAAVEWPELLGRDPRPLWLFLDGVQDPGNAGTLVRSADAAGVGAVLAGPGTVDLFNPKAVRSAMGSVFRVPVAVNVDPAEALGAFAGRGLPVFAASARGAIEYHKADYSGGGLVVVGNENRGLSSAFDDPRVAAVAVPMRPGVDSLNAAVSGSVILFRAVLGISEVKTDD